MARYVVQNFIDAIPGSAGIITTIAKRVGCDWVTAKKWINERPTVKAVYDAECEKLVDAAESVIIKDIVELNDVQTAKWYLTMKGRKRGYVKTERHEVEAIDRAIERELARMAAEREAAVVDALAAYNAESDAKGA